MDSNEMINRLVARIDKLTLHLHPERHKLFLFGSLDSIFLKAILKKAQYFGVECGIYQDEISNHDIAPQDGIVVDVETYTKLPLYPSWSRDSDLDGLIHPARSCVSEAMIRLLREASLISGKSITIIGRGHSTKGLADYLIKHDATVTVAHSKTKDIASVTRNQDVVLICAPKLDQDISYDTKSMVIDLGCTVPHPEQYDCEYVTRIGKLTIIILLYRLSIV